jgi:hypothetical protein
MHSGTQTKAARAAVFNKLNAVYLSYKRCHMYRRHVTYSSLRLLILDQVAGSGPVMSPASVRYLQHHIQNELQTASDVPFA